ncbi:MAG: lipopolysaccharide biosynthesis protein [Sediminibacterium sp.]|jgi:O-antigen/teichoic acid export membrane protein|nr:oligosaccharide flippase family protein [Chitinophagaceae bacterium]MCA6447728.1 oligosaccharide flippase family protein [Chitinophagaceae bacterium]
MSIFNKQIWKTNSNYVFNVGTTFLSQGIAALTVLLITPVLLHNLGIKNFALYGIVINLVNTAVVFDFGLNIGLLRKLILNKENSSSLISSVLIFYISLGLITIPLIYLLNKNVLINYAYWPVGISIFIAFLFTQNTVVQLFDNLIQTQNKIYIGKLIRSVKLSVEFLLIWIAATYQSLVFIFGIMIFLNFIYIFTLYFFAKRELTFSLSTKLWSKKLLVSHLTYSGWYFAGSLATVLVFNAQMILISFQAAATEISGYLVVTRFFDIIRIGLTNFTQVLFPKIVQITTGANWEEIKKLFLSVWVKVALASVVAYLLLLTVGLYFFNYWSSLNNLQIIKSFKLFSLFIVLVVLDNVAVVFLAALKFNKLPTIISLFQGALGLFLGYIWLQHEGIAGVIKASLVAFICTNFLFNTGYLWHMLKQKIQVNGCEES